MRNTQNNKGQSILGVSIDTTSYEAACQLILNWQANQVSKLIYFANVHMVMTAYDSPDFKALLNQADLVTPDGMPLVWTLRLMGNKTQGRVYGPTLTQKLLPMLEERDIPIGFYGSSPEVLERLQQKIVQRHPKIIIAYAYSPPFRELTDSENQEIIERINHSGVKVLFIGLGCPKQEYWMHAHRDQVRAVMLGVGAAFDFIAGTKSQAPLWVQRIGMEWFYRLVTEPKRLWQRYFYNNPRFVVLVAHQLIRDWLIQAKK